MHSRIQRFRCNVLSSNEIIKSSEDSQAGEEAGTGWRRGVAVRGGGAGAAWRGGAGREAQLDEAADELRGQAMLAWAAEGKEAMARARQL